METYGVLVVDDSAFMRKSISAVVEKDARFKVIGIARNGLEAIEKIKRLRPHVVTMDVEMPEMDGLSAVERIMEEYPVPIVMVSSRTLRGTRTTIQALQLGAVDCVHKDSLLSETVSQQPMDFHARLEAAASANMMARHRRAASVAPKVYQSTHTAARVERMPRHLELIIIGCSTGGPAALQSILPRLNASLEVPVMVIQHMPPGFTKSLAERFDSLSSIQVKEAEDGEILRSGSAYIAPAGRQLVFARKNGGLQVELRDTTTIDTRFRPSVDVALMSAAPLCRHGLLSVILTGMGNDGTLGCKEVRGQGGRVIVQSEASCVVYGMPKSVVEAGYADEQLSLDSISDRIQQIVMAN